MTKHAHREKGHSGMKSMKGKNFTVHRSIVSHQNGKGRNITTLNVGFPTKFETEETAVI